MGADFGMAIGQRKPVIGSTRLLRLLGNATFTSAMMGGKSTVSECAKCSYRYRPMAGASCPVCGSIVSCMISTTDITTFRDQRELIHKMITDLESGRTGFAIKPDLPLLRGILATLDGINDQNNLDEGPTCPGCTNPGDCEDCEYDIDVVFLRNPYGGDIFAVFPGKAATTGNPSHMACYTHEGGNSAAGTAYCEGCVEATGYTDLFIELCDEGYNPRVVSKDSMFSAKYVDSRREQLKG